MKVAVTRIGNSKGIRIPKPLLDELGLENEVELDVEGDHLVIRPSRAVRDGWDKAFTKMKERGDDVLLDSDDIPPTQWDKREWEW